MKFKKLMKPLLISLFLMSTSATANLIQNGSFEELDNSANIGSEIAYAVEDIVEMSDLSVSGDWGVFNGLAFWDILDSEGVELQYSGTVVDAQSGEVYMEMDTDPSLAINGYVANATILQEIADLIIGDVYELSFWAQARTDTPAENGLVVSWFSGSDKASGVQESVITIKDDGNWTEYVYKFIATDSTMNIAFSGAGTETGKGAFLDNISLIAVPEPNVLVLMLVGLFGLSMRKKHS